MGDESNALTGGRLTQQATPATCVLELHGSPVRDVEVDEMGLDARQVARYSGQLVESFGQRPSVRMVLGQAVDHGVERNQSRCCQHPGLAHRASESLAPPACVIDAL